MTAKHFNVFIDNCAWDVLHRYGINLAIDLPASEFSLFVTKEVGSFEMVSIPDGKEELRTYIRRQMKESAIREHSYFGFTSYNNPPGFKDRVGGFGEGVWASQEELKLLERFKVSPGKERKTGLYRNEADASLAVRACAGDVVLTAEKPDNGPLKEAAEETGRVVSLLGFDPSSTTLRDFVLDSIGR